MNRKVIDIIFAFLVFALPFKYVPRILWQNTLGGPFGNDLVVYPLLIGFVYTLYCQWKYGNVLCKWGIFRKYIGVYVVVLFVSLAWGLITYPYYDQILAGPADQFEKLPKVLALLQSIGVPIAEKTLLKFWMFAHPIKAVMLEVLYTFGAAYMIFCWYYGRAQRAVDILLKMTTIDLVIIAAYGLVDACYQSGQMWAQSALMIFNPILHADVSIQAIPLETIAMFRDAQNRSIFLEPSYYGIYMAFAYPILWWNMFRVQALKAKVALWLLFVVLTFEVFLAQSRMALVVDLGAFAAFTVICIYRTQKQLLAFCIALLVGGGIAFGGSMAFLRYCQVPTAMGDPRPLAFELRDMPKAGGERKGFDNFTAKSYFKEGLGSLSSQYNNKEHLESNHTRFTVQKTYIQMGLEHPILGVGPSLRQGYLRDKLDKDPGIEIQTWNKTMDKKGWIRSGYPATGGFTLRFAETGFLGLGLYLLPAFGLFLLYAKALLKRKSDIVAATPYIFSAVSFLGIMVTGLGDEINITFCYWVAVAIGYIVTVKE